MASEAYPVALVPELPTFWFSRIQVLASSTLKPQQATS
jgi:hypothetical protein